MVSSIVLTSLQKDVLVGTILGEASMVRVKSTHNTRFDQTDPAHISYLFLFFYIFYNLTRKPHRIKKRKPD